MQGHTPPDGGCARKPCIELHLATAGIARNGWNTAGPNLSSGSLPLMRQRSRNLQRSMALSSDDGVDWLGTGRLRTRRGGLDGMNQFIFNLDAGLTGPYKTEQVRFRKLLFGSVGLRSNRRTYVNRLSPPPVFQTSASKDVPVLVVLKGCLNCPCTAGTRDESQLGRQIDGQSDCRTGWTSAQTDNAA